MAIDKVPTREYIASLLNLVNSGRKLDADSLAGLGDVHLVDGSVVRSEDVSSLFRAYENGATWGSMKGLNSDSAEQIYVLASEYVRGGALAKGAALLRYLCTNEHLNPRNWLALGKTQCLQGKCKEAINSLSFGQLLDNKNPEFPLEIALIHLKEGNIDQGISAIDHCVALSRSESNKKTELEKKIQSVRDSLNRKRKSADGGAG